MSKTIKLKGNNKDYLSIDLSEIVGLIQNGNDYFWMILWISGVGRLNSGKAIPDYSFSPLRDC